jgi:hypothetical protein
MKHGAVGISDRGRRITIWSPGGAEPIVIEAPEEMPLPKAREVVTRVLLELARLATKEMQQA